MTSDAAVVVSQASRRFGARVAVNRADLVLRPGRITALLGPSGCGKSTLLRMIAGLEPLDGGQIRGGDQWSADARAATPPEARDVGLVFQDYALFPHLTVLQNVAFGLRGLPRAERKARAMALLESVRLADRASAWPHALSGGEQQRVALARALARRPRAVLLDEPFSGLDRHLKAEVREGLVAALRQAGAAVLIVTHDAEEALLTADDLALMSAGRILQTGMPEDCYRRPASLTAARLLGEVETLPAMVTGGVAASALGRFPAPGLTDGPAVVAARPHDLTITQDPGEAEVRAVRFGGGWHEATVALGDHPIVLRVTGAPPAVGARVALTVDPARVSVFPA